MRLAFIIDSLGRGGTQTALAHLVEGLSARGHAQIVISLNDDVSPFIRRRLEAAGTKVFVVGKKRIVCLWGVISLYLMLRRLKPDAVMTMLPYSDYIGRTIAKISGVKSIYSSTRARNIHKKWWQYTLDKITAPFADKIIVNARNLGPFVMQYEGVTQEQLEYIPNGVRMEPAAIGAGSSLREENGVRPEETLLLAVGRLNAQKGYPVLFRALSRLIANGCPVKLWIAGSGPQLDMLKALAEKLRISDAIFFWGLVDDLPDLLAAADILVHAAHFEGMPNVVMEAMHAGLPVVATAVDGACELIEDGVDGVLVQPGDERALAEAVDEVLSDPVRMERMGRLASEKMRTGFSVEKMVDRYESLFAGRLAARGAAREWIESRSVNGN